MGEGRKKCGAVVGVVRKPAYNLACSRLQAIIEICK
jgi:hypothetical protein